MNKMDLVEKAKGILQAYDGPKVRIMEVCGTHTHEIFRLGIRGLLPEKVELISGPGCPVCVTPVDFIDEARYLAEERKVTVCTFGDLVRVPGSTGSLAASRAAGGRVQVVYSPGDAVDYAKAHPEEDVVFLSVGFETTTPASCLAVEKAAAEGVSNFSLLTANKTMPAAYNAMKDSVDVFLYPGHVHAIIGTSLCKELAESGVVSGVVSGFTAGELLTALAVAVSRFGKGEGCFYANAYPRVVPEEGNPRAVELVNRLMQPCDVRWRGLGIIPGSGMELRQAYAAYDARKKYQVPKMEGRENPGCRCGQVLQGKCTPEDCPLFGKVCTPLHPVGACMVSNEGACSAWYQYGR